MIPSVIKFPIVAVMVVLLFYLAVGNAATTGNGSNDLFSILGSGSPVGNGDWYSANNGGGLNAYYSYWIEVPPGSPNLRVQIFDADVGNTHDDSLGTSFDTTVEYRLYPPGGGAPIRSATCGTTCTDLNDSNANNRWRRFSSDVISPAAGIWELQVDMSSAVTTGNDVNIFGLRVRSRDGNTDYNVFYYENVSGSLRSVNPRTVTNYPYITSGCTLGSNDFDFDVPGGGNGSSMSVTSRLGTNTAISPLSAPSAWSTQSIIVEGRDDSAEDYGLWTLAAVPAHTGIGNVVSWYLNTEGSASGAPSSPFTLNNGGAHRIYLPTGTRNTPGGPPVKPYLAQWVRQNDPTGNPNEFTITIRLINPTAHAITGAVATGEVPSPVTYGGVRSGLPTHGSMTSAPSVGSSGLFSWDVGTVAAGETAVMAYNIIVPNPNMVTTVTGISTTGNATRASFDDETGTPFNTGGLCELRIGPGLTLAVVSDFEVVAQKKGAVATWNTASEIGTVGFYLERQDKSSGEWVRLNEGEPIPGLGLSQRVGGSYRVLDLGVSAGESHRYRLVELEAKGNRRIYGPYEVVVGEPSANRRSQTAAYSVIPREKNRQRIVAERDRRAIARNQVGGAPAGIRIGIRETGLHYLSAAQIAAGLGLDVSTVSDLIDQQELALSLGGQAVAWLAKGSEGLYFYAEAIDSIYTRDNVVLLEVDKGEIMTSQEGGNPTGPATASEFMTTVRIEEDLLFAPFKPVQDYWFWKKLTNEEKAPVGEALFDFSLDGVGAGQGALKLHIEGFTEVTHFFEIFLNGQSLGTYQTEGLLDYHPAVTIPGGLLQTGSNQLRLVHRPLSSEESTLFIDGFEISYPRTFHATGDYLVFMAEAGTFELSGFTGSEIMLFNLANPLRPVQVVNAAATADGLRFQVNEDEEGAYLVVAPDAVKAPAWVEPHDATRLATPQNQADYLVIAPEELKAGAQALADYRAGQGLITRVVTLKEIYLAFNHGIEDPRAIERFVSYARDHWLVAPRYVVLAGDSSYDHRQILPGSGDHRVPAIYTGTPDGLFAADNLYGAMQGGAPRVAVGRIPALSNAELSAYVNKLAAWESGLTTEQAVQLVADNADYAGQFPQDSNGLKLVLTTAMVATDIHLNPSDVAASRQALMDALNEGRGLVNYLGHGGFDRLADEGLLTSADVPGLANTRTPVTTALSCIVNLHDEEGYDSLGESMVLRVGGGAIAMWAPTGLSQNASAVELNRELLSSLYESGHPVLGDAIVAALKEYAKMTQVSYMPRLYTLLGDPAVWLRPGAPKSERIYNEQLGAIESDLDEGASLFGCTGKTVALTDKQFVWDQDCMAVEQLSATGTVVETDVSVRFCSPSIRLGAGFGVKGRFTAGAQACSSQ